MSIYYHLFIDILFLVYKYVNIFRYIFYKVGQPHLSENGSNITYAHPYFDAYTLYYPRFPLYDLSC